MARQPTLRLFQVVERPGVIHYFKNKQEAKRFRDKIKGAKVSPGPDHWRQRSC